MKRWKTRKNKQIQINLLFFKGFRKTVSALPRNKDWETSRADLWPPSRIHELCYAVAAFLLACFESACPHLEGMVTTHQDTLILILRWSISILLGMVSWAHLASLDVLNMKMMRVTCWPSQSKDFNLFECIREIWSPHVCVPHHHRHHLTLNLLENGVSLLLFPISWRGVS